MENGSRNSHVFIGKDNRGRSHFSVECKNGKKIRKILTPEGLWFTMQPHH